MNVIKAILYLERWRWYRRLVGGKWSQWSLWIAVPDVWVQGWERPGCGAWCNAKEDWSSELKR